MNTGRVIICFALSRRLNLCIQAILVLCGCVCLCEHKYVNVCVCYLCLGYTLDEQIFLFVFLGSSVWSASLNTAVTQHDLCSQNNEAQLIWTCVWATSAYWQQYKAKKYDDFSDMWEHAAALYHQYVFPQGITVSDTTSMSALSTQTLPQGNHNWRWWPPSAAEDIWGSRQRAQDVQIPIQHPRDEEEEAPTRRKHRASGGV